MLIFLNEMVLRLSQYMLKIRLQRIGRKNQAYFRVVVLEHTVKPKGRYLELLGSYDPHKNAVTVKEERIKYWMGKGAKLSATINNLLVERKLIEGEKMMSWKPKKKSKKEEDKKEESTVKVETKTEAPAEQLSLSQ